MIVTNPIIQKEVLTSLRTRKAFVMQGAYLLIAALLVLLYWPSDGLQDIAGQKAMRIFSTLALGQLVMVVLFAPAFTAASLTSEKERRTWESLYVTTMKPWQIALGKMVGSLAFLLLLVLSGSVTLALPLLLGGVSGGKVVAAVLLMLLTAVYLGMIGLSVSVDTHRSYRSIIITYAILLGVCFFAAMPVWPMSQGLMQRGGPLWQQVFHVIASISPLQAMLSLIWPGSPYATPAAGMPPYWVLFIPISLVATAAMVAYCLYRLRRPIAPPRPREGLHVVERNGKITARSILFLVDPRKRKRPIARWQNPVLIKEFRTRPMLQTHWLIRAVLICLVVAVCLMIAVAFSVSALVGENAALVPAIATFIAAMMVLLILIIGPAIASGSICADRETGVWDLMRTTPLSSASIVIGKFLSSIVPIFLISLATLPPLILLLYFDLKVWPALLRIGAVAAMTILFVSVTGTFFSSILKRTAAATAWTYAVVAVVGLLSLIVLLDPDAFSYGFVRSVFILNPIATAMGVAGSSTMQQYGLFGAHLLTMSILTGILLVITVVRVYQLRRPD